jgi:TolB-like protein
MRLRHLSRAAVAAAFTILSLAAPPAGAESPLRILILPIVVHSAATDPSHVSGGLSEMIASRLEQSGRVFVERPEDESLATSQVGDALREGKARDVDFVIYGAFTQFGDGASLDIQCIPVQVASEAEAVAARRIFIQSGAVGEIIPRLDEISGRLAAYVNAGQPDSEELAPEPALESATISAPEPGSDVLRSIAERLQALEEAVFGGGDASANAQLDPGSPES